MFIENIKNELFFCGVQAAIGDIISEKSTT